MNSPKLIPWNWFKREEPSQPRSRVVAAHSPLYMDLDRLFDSLFSGYPPHRQLTAPGLSKELGETMIRPNLDISGDDEHYYVTVELPGVDENNLTVDVENDTLRISGEKRYEHSEGDAKDAGTGKNYYRVERSYGSFLRILALPDDVDAADISATHKDGVLTITLPRKKELLQQQRRIQINKE